MYTIDYLLDWKLETLYFQYVSFLLSIVTMFDLSMKCTLWWRSFD